MSHRDVVYPHGHAAPVLRSHGWRTAQNSAGYLLPRLRPADRLLDVGTGPGTITCDLAALVPQGRVLGIDRAPAAVEATRALAQARGLTNLSVEVGDAHGLDLPDGAVDVAHAHQVLQHLGDPVDALRELRRVVRPGGLLAVRDADYAAMVWHPRSTALERWRDLYSALARHDGGEPDAGRRLRGWVQAAGWREPVCTAATWCYATEEDLGWWTGTWAERLTGSDFAAQAVSAGLSTPDELAALAAGWREFGRRPDAWFTVLHGEVIAVR